MINKYFIAVYTNEVKDYCDEKFFDNLYMLSQGEPVFVIDNSIGNSYCNRLQKMFFQQNEYDNFALLHMDIPEVPKESQFHRNICVSVNYLRKIYLEHSDFPYFLIIESDVYPPADLLDKFENSINRINIRNPGWGIVGGLYYQGFHNYDFNTTVTSFESTFHCLAGCTVYKRSLIESYPFRYEPENLGPFPDAFICFDSGKNYSLWNEHQIVCDHLHNPLNGMRVR